jgi:hypothetical protein
MMAFVQAFILVSLCAVAALHAYWALGGFWPGHDGKSLAAAVVGVPGMRAMPGRAITLAVAAMLLFLALWPGFLAPWVAANVAPFLAPLGSLLIALVFLGRGVARMVPSLKRRHSAEPFATYDARYFSPFCLALGVAFGLVSLSGVL